MRDWLAGVVGENLAPIVTVILAAAVVILLALILIGLAKRVFAGTGGIGSRTRAPRVAILDITPIDPKRKLVLLRRDEVEHLILIGGQNDLVIEPSIMRGQTPRRARPEQSVRQEPDFDREGTAERNQPAPVPQRRVPQLPANTMPQPQAAPSQAVAAPQAVRRPEPSPVPSPTVRPPEPHQVAKEVEPVESADLKMQRNQQTPQTAPVAAASTPVGPKPQTVREPSPAPLPAIETPRRREPSAAPPVVTPSPAKSPVGQQSSQSTSAEQAPPVQPSEIAREVEPKAAPTVEPAQRQPSGAQPTLIEPPVIDPGTSAASRPTLPPIQPRSMATPTLPSPPSAPNPAPVPPAPTAPSTRSLWSAVPTITVGPAEPAEGRQRDEREEITASPQRAVDAPARNVGAPADLAAPSPSSVPVDVPVSPAARQAVTPTIDMESRPKSPVVDVPAVTPPTPTETRQPLSVRSFATTIQSRRTPVAPVEKPLAEPSSEIPNVAPPSPDSNVPRARDTQPLMPELDEPAATQEGNRPVSSTRPLTLEEEMERLLHDFTLDVSERR